MCQEFLPFLDEYSIVCIDHFLFIHLSVSGLGLFPCEQECVSISSGLCFFVYILRSGLLNQIITQ